MDLANGIHIFLASLDRNVGGRQNNEDLLQCFSQNHGTMSFSFLGRMNEALEQNAFSICF